MQLCMVWMDGSGLHTRDGGVCLGYPRFAWLMDGLMGAGGMDRGV